MCVRMEFGGGRYLPTKLFIALFELSSETRISFIDCNTQMQKLALLLLLLLEERAKKKKERRGAQENSPKGIRIWKLPTYERILKKT